MPFPVDEKYIKEAEKELGVKFPSAFKERMMEYNGGEIESLKFQFRLHPFFDKTDRKRISRTCNHIVHESAQAREWNGFPSNGIAIGADDCGNQIVMMPNGDGILNECIYFFDHETSQLKKIADSIHQLDQS